MQYGLLDELLVSKWSSFYIENCLDFSTERRRRVLSKLEQFIAMLEESNPYYNAIAFGGTDKMKVYRKSEINRFIRTEFDDSIYENFSKKLSVDEVKETLTTDSDDHLIIRILGEWVNLSEKMKQESKVQADYKLNYLKFLHECISNYGLNPIIESRPDEHFKKYCVRIKGRDFVEYRFLCEKEEVLNEFVLNYLSNEDIIVNGRIVKIKEIERLNIFSTKLNKSELQLFALKHKLVWNPLSPLNRIDHLLSKLKDVTSSFISARKKRNYLKSNEESDTKTVHSSNRVGYNEIVSLISFIQERKTLELSEDQFNDYLTDLLRAKGYNVSDQTRSGRSSTEKQSGELDIVIRDIKGNITVIIETFIIKSCGIKCPIARQHINKLINFYNANGVENLFAIAIYKGKNFSSFCNNYYQLLFDDQFGFENETHEIGLTNTKVIKSLIRKDMPRIKLISILSNFS